MSWSQTAIRSLRREGERLERVNRSALIRLATQTAVKSPVGDTGFFRASWIGSYGSIDRQTFSDSGRDSVGAFSVLLGSVGNHNFVYLTNSMPYALRLEYGWSMQAPGGVVRVTARNFPRYFREANESTR